MNVVKRILTALSRPARRCSLWLCCGAWIATPLQTHAMELRANIGLDSEYTTDAALQTLGEQDDIIKTVNLGLGLTQQGRNSALAVNAGLRALHYTRDSFADRQYLNMTANANWETVKNRLDWQLQNRFTQQRINALDPDVPVNLQDVNVFSFGPQITLRLSRKQDVIIRPRFIRNYYEVSIADSQQYVLTLSWLNRLRKALVLSVNADYSNVRYDVVPADYQSTSLDVGFAGTWSRSQYAVRLGTTNIERDSGSQQRGDTFSLNWRFNASNTLTFNLDLASRFAESGSALLATTTVDNLDDVADQQITTGAVRNKSLALSVDKRFRRVTLSMRLQDRSLDYTGGADDRDIRLAGLGATYRHSAVMRSTLAYRRIQTELADGSRDDDARSLTYTLQRELTRTLDASLRLRKRLRDSNIATSVYDESAVILSLRYAWRD